MLAPYIQQLGGYRPYSCDELPSATQAVRQVAAAALPTLYAGLAHEPEIRVANHCVFLVDKGFGRRSSSHATAKYQALLDVCTNQWIEDIVLIVLVRGRILVSPGVEVERLARDLSQATRLAAVRAYVATRLEQITSVIAASEPSTTKRPQLHGSVLCVESGSYLIYLPECDELFPLGDVT